MITTEQQDEVTDIANEMLNKLIQHIKEKGTTRSVLEQALREATRRGYLRGISFRSNRQWRLMLDNPDVAHTSAYKKAKYAAVGLETECPSCGNAFVKTTNKHTFCNKGCKEKYWESLGDQTI
jgi:hypothetical protein